MSFPFTIAAALAQATAQLQAASTTPRLDAELLLVHTLGWSRTQVLAEARYTLEPQQQAAFGALVARRQQLEPIAYITGHREFFGLDFLVTPATLVPRPETELLVELALHWISERPAGQVLRVADIGTGTGCIAIAIAVHAPHTQLLAVDVSAAALAVAAANVAYHAVQAQVQLAEGDLLTSLETPVDLLVSNPPYTILRENDENVNRHEPQLALDGGSDGLDVYRRLLCAAPGKLAAGGAMMLEIGAAQAAAIIVLAAHAFPRASLMVQRDLAGRDRVVVIDTAEFRPQTVDDGR